MRDEGTLGATVQADLHALLKRVLAKALQGRAGVNEAAIEDFAQDAVLKILAKLDTFRGDSRFATWASAVAIRTALTALRRAHWQDVSLDEAQVNLERTNVMASDVGAQAQRQQITEAIYGIIERDLSERQRQVLRSELAGVPRAVLAKRLETNQNALYKLAHDARKRLRAGLERAGFGAEDVRQAFDE